MKYFYIVMGAILLVLIGSVVKKEMNTENTRVKRIACQSEVVVFERVNPKAEMVKKAVALIKEGKYTLNPTIQKSEYMQTQLFNHVNSEMTDQFIHQALNKLTGSSWQKDEDGVQINYLIYENDKDNPGKKTKKSKLYAGYLVFEFFVDKERAYKMQIDFMDIQGKDIEKRIMCTMQSFLTL